MIALVYKFTPLALFLGYPLMLITLFITKDERLFKAVIIPLVTFLEVTIFRMIFDRPRPYETYSITPLFPKTTKGKSFPSRHVASAVIINIAFFYINPWIGLASLPITLLIIILRPVAGVHYISDVIFAVITGLVFGSAFYIF